MLTLSTLVKGKAKSEKKKVLFILTALTFREI